MIMEPVVVILDGQELIATNVLKDMVDRTAIQHVPKLAVKFVMTKEHVLMEPVNVMMDGQELIATNVLKDMLDLIVNIAGKQHVTEKETHVMMVIAHVKYLVI